jgi:type VI secretion system protein ImpK
MTAPHLADCFTAVMAYVSEFLVSVESGQPPYRQVRDGIHRLLAESQAQAEQERFPAEDYDQARFAVCAWIDEAILSSRWLEKTCWLDDQLQRFHYQTAEAGEQFFERLDCLGPQPAVREVFYLCLALGFTGRYCRPEDRYGLEQIKTANLKLLLGNPVEIPSLDREEFSPDLAGGGRRESGDAIPRTGSRLIGAVCLTAPVLLFAILYLVYRFTLTGISDNFLKSVGQLR